MIRYAAGRVLQIVPVLFGVSIVVFLLIRLIPGNPAVAILGERATPELVERVKNQLGLDLPIWRQYLHFLGNASSGSRSRSASSPTRW
jgi:peptide/nickel transport system permease protein